jgi:hypothetical protein
MKKTHVMMILGSFMILLFFQLACATGEEPKLDTKPAVVEEKSKPEAAAPAKVEEASKPEAAAPAKVEEATTTAVLLADTHKKAGVECADCHTETPPAVETPTSVCLGCHKDYKERAASSVDPHNAHVTFENCGDCHHSHKTSENQCLSCHTFSLKAP